MTVAQIQEMWAKLNANERLVGYGAIVVIIASLVGIFGGGVSYGFVTAVVVLVIYWLKYAPNQNINWPLPVPTLVLLITGIAALLTVLPALGLLSVLGFFGLWGIAYLVSVVGLIVMAWGAWKEYQAMPKAGA